MCIILWFVFSDCLCTCCSEVIASRSWKWPFSSSTLTRLQNECRGVPYKYWSWLRNVLFILKLNNTAIIFECIESILYWIWSDSYLYHSVNVYSLNRTVKSALSGIHDQQSWSTGKMVESLTIFYSCVTLQCLLCSENLTGSIFLPLLGVMVR
jgi:hypothetical protein